MKRFLPLTIMSLLLASCADMTKVAQVAAVANQILNSPTGTSTPSQPSLTAADIARGLKEALTIGAQNSTAQASQENGFYNNARLFIPFPEEAIKVKNTLEKAGLNKPVETFTLTLNRAAEEASKTAKPIVVSAITSMTISDALGILKGDSTAATQYLRRTTSDQLTQAFTPIVRDAISKVKLTSYWEPVVNTYNKLTFLTGGEKVNPNLEEYITQRTIDGLFVLIADEEKNIRANPAARVTDLLKRVFGSIAK